MPLSVQAPSSHTPAIAVAYRSQGGSRRDTRDEVRGDQKTKGLRSLEKQQMASDGKHRATEATPPATGTVEVN